jgi:DNA invertase Pin-like site-specific DNA recombinase
MTTCANERFCNNRAPSAFSGFLRCETLLLYLTKWRYICAMLFGYARVSKDDQDTATQVAALKAAGCEKIYREKASGGRWDRPELHRLIEQLRKGDVLVVWKLDRLSRSLRDVLILMERLGQTKAGFKSLTEAIDTTTPAGRMMMQMVGVFAEFERAMLKERTKAGLETARQEGRIGGRRAKLSLQQQAEIRKMVSKGDKTAADAARLFKIHPATVSRLLARPSTAVFRKREYAK